MEFTITELGREIHMSQTRMEEFDVLVIGSGFAGLAAAIEAAQLGSSVLVIEKNRSTGGNSRINDGGIAAPETDIQEKFGYVDSKELMYQDMMGSGLGLNYPELVRKVVDEARDTFYWTRDYLGVTYMDRIDLFGGHSVHRCYTAENISGSTIVDKQLKRLEELGVEVRTSTEFHSFMCDEEGGVMGIHCLTESGEGTEYEVLAGKGVVLATGGYGADISFRMSQDPRLNATIDTTNRSSATAEGMKECLRLGAMPVHLSHIQLGPWGSPDEKGYGHGPMFSEYIVFQYGIIVDPENGERFVDELSNRKSLSDSILFRKQPCIGFADHKALSLAGWDISKALKKQVVRPFESLEDLAKHYDIPRAALIRTVEEFNGYVESGEDLSFHKNIMKDASPIQQPPYYAIRLWPKVHHVSGGVAISSRAQVLDLDNNPIEGLYAAGEVTGGTHGACRLGSCGTTECLVFGRIAGKEAANR